MKKLLIGLMLVFSASLFASETIDIVKAVNVELINDANSTHIDEANGTLASPISYYAIPPTGKKWHIGNFVGYLEGQTAFSSEKFGNLTELTNGVIIKINGVEVAVWKTNLDIALMVNRLDVPIALAKADRAILGTWSLAQAFGKPVLIGADGIEFIVQDDLTGLVDFHVNVQGLER